MVAWVAWVEEELPVGDMEGWEADGGKRVSSFCRMRRVSR